MSRIRSILKKVPWYFWIALGLLCFESATNTTHLFEQYHYWIALRDQPIVTIGYVFLVFSRLLALYVFFAVIYEGLLHTVPQRWWRQLLPGYTRCGLYLVLYAFASRHVFLTSPSISGFYGHYLPRTIALLCFIAGVLYAAGIAIHRKWPDPVPTVPWSDLLAQGGVCLLYLILSANRTPWNPPRSSVGSPLRPSFILLGFDGIPEDSFEGTAGPTAAAPLWHQKWKTRALRFENAYSVTNSTFTSWFSILSGRYPFHSGVETLYPNAREGNQNLENLLPRKLQSAGYRTLFMTDCGTTSYMKPEYGFDNLYQLAPGLFQCGQSLLTSKHPLAWFLDFGGWRNSLLPELDSFCSAQYRPEDFFKRVGDTLAQLQAQNEPFFLAVHSCATHQSMIHQPAMDSHLRDDLPPSFYSHSDRLKSLLLSIRIADYHLDRLLEQIHRSKRNLWTFFFADHGTRFDNIDGQLKYFTHAMGMPVNRFQYKVPLALWGTDVTAGSERELAALLDLYPTVLERAGLSVPPQDGASLFHLPSRGLILTSAMPLELSPTNREMFDAFWENKVDGNGFHSFPRTLEIRLLRNRPLAYLKPPYRLLMRPEKGIQLYNEWEDPFGQRDLYSTEPRRASKLLEELCKQYQGPGCAQPLGG
ncbi:MAG: sulfatase-like hydrolase/transferase [Bdellovibrionales bacterium]|nr:sulfatase-like hydrolase/transferase [Bdellovibrionales bacterium]